jgi:hypothetical protein
VLLDRALVALRRLIVLEAAGKLVSMIEDLLNRTGHQGHLRNRGLVGMA